MGPTFPPPPAPPTGAQVGYSGSLAASVPINAALVAFGATAGVAWASTLLLTGVANYFLLDRLLGNKKREE